MRAQFVLSEIGIGLRRNLTMTIAVVVTVAISLALFGSGLLIRKQVETMKDFWYDKVEVSVYLCGELSDAVTCGGQAVTDAQRAMDEATQALVDGAPGADDAYATALERWLGLGGADLDDRAEETADALGLTVDLDQPMTSLSGGQAARAGLAELSDRVWVPAENLVTPEVVRRLCWDWQPADDTEAAVEAFLSDAQARSWQRELVVPVLAAALSATPAP